MILRFCSGSLTPGQLAEEPLARVDDAQVGLERVAEQRLDLGRLVRALQAGVDEDAGQARAHRLQHQRRRHRRIDAARQAADRAPVRPDLRRDRRDRLARRSRPSSSSARSRRCETGSSRGSPRRAACAPPRGGTARPRTCAPAPPPPPPGSWRSRRRSRSRPAAPRRDRRATSRPGSPRRRAKPWNRSPALLHAHRRAPVLAPLGRDHLAAEAPARSAACRSRCRGSARPARTPRSRSSARPRRSRTPDRPTG